MPRPSLNAPLTRRTHGPPPRQFPRLLAWLAFAQWVMVAPEPFIAALGWHEFTLTTTLLSMALSLPVYIVVQREAQTYMKTREAMDEQVQL